MTLFSPATTAARLHRRPLMPNAVARLLLTLLLHHSARAALLAPAQLNASSTPAPAANSAAADAFDQLARTQFRSAAAVSLQASTARAWRIERYALSVYGLHGAQVALAPTAWTLWCLTTTTTNAGDAWVQLDSRSGVTLG